MNNNDRPKRGIILTVGITHEPVTYCLEQTQADYAVFICTAQSRVTLDRVLEDFPLAPSHCQTREIEDRPEEIGRLIGEFYQGFLWLRDQCNIEPQNIFTDPTPGRKWMSAGTTMIGSFLGLGLFYTDAKFKDGKPDKASMQFVTLGNAFDQTGFLEAEKGREAFNRGQFQLAQRIFDSLRPTLSGLSDLYAGLAGLCQVLHRWDLFEHYASSLAVDFDAALEQLKRSDNSKAAPPGFDRFLQRLRDLRDAVQQVTDDPKPSLLATVDLVCNARRRHDAGRYDDAVARIYRALESLSQYYLLTGYGLDAAKPDFERLDEAQRQAIRDRLGELPTQISLDNGWKILWDLEDPAAQCVFQRNKKGELNNKFSGVLANRNNSILAHGWEPVGRETSKKLIERFEQLLRDAEAEQAPPAMARFVTSELPAFFARRPDAAEED